MVKNDLPTVAFTPIVSSRKVHKHNSPHVYTHVDTAKVSRQLLSQYCQHGLTKFEFY